MIAIVAAYGLLARDHATVAWKVASCEQTVSGALSAFNRISLAVGFHRSNITSASCWRPAPSLGFSMSQGLLPHTSHVHLATCNVFETSHLRFVPRGSRCLLGNGCRALMYPGVDHAYGLEPSLPSSSAVVCPGVHCYEAAAKQAVDRPDSTQCSNANQQAYCYYTRSLQLCILSYIAS
jgi:hypothetical protein